MDSNISVQLVANAGIFLRYHGVGILIDGLFRDAPAPFLSPDCSVRERLLQAGPPYGPADHIFFTHEHADHFSALETIEYLHRHPVRSVFLPRPAETDLTKLLQVCSAAGVPCHLLQHDMPAAPIPLGGDISVQCFFTRHLDALYAHIPHVCYLFSFGAQKLFITADADYRYETFDFLPHTTLDAAFLNPLFFNALSSKRLFRGSIAAQRCFVYHIPSGADTVGAGMRAMLERSLSRWDCTRGRAILLEDPTQQYLL